MVKTIEAEVVLDQVILRLVELGFNIVEKFDGQDGVAGFGRILLPLMGV